MQDDLAGFVVLRRKRLHLIGEVLEQQPVGAYLRCDGETPVGIRCRGREAVSSITTATPTTGCRSWSTTLPRTICPQVCFTEKSARAHTSKRNVRLITLLGFFIWFPCKVKPRCGLPVRNNSCLFVCKMLIYRGYDPADSCRRAGHPCYAKKRVKNSLSGAPDSAIRRLSFDLSV